MASLKEFAAPKWSGSSGDFRKCVFEHYTGCSTYYVHECLDIWILRRAALG